MTMVNMPVGRNTCLKIRLDLRKDWHTYQDTLEGTIVDLADKNLNTKASSNQTSENTSRPESEWNLQQLSLQPLRRWEDLNSFPSNRIYDFFLMLEILSFSIDAGYASNTPTNSQVDLLMFPVFRKDCAPQRINYSVYWREMAEQHPRREPKYRREYEEGKV